jgi:hypothetical protein
MNQEMMKSREKGLVSSDSICSKEPGGNEWKVND